ncbi:RNA polymerase sigma factor [Burkholderia sp. L27(2015)]|uniref:RNA polymerase sigma factor n=1 Tax=Burkholderia sp. L27(2015) TaxID=1641858 RepID=UPI00131C1FFB|nr:RNA polymerase sigma factor [Burkholderia sp. L27(2015)]
MGVREEIMQHVPRLRRYARALVRDHDLADDLVQDTLERGLRNTARFRPGSDLRAWLSTIMHNVFVNQISKLAWHAPHVQVEEVAESEFAIYDNHSQSLEVRDIDDALQKLSTEQREVILLVALDEMSYAEVASALQIPIGTVMSRLSRARERLRELMPDSEYGEKRKVVS